MITIIERKETRLNEILPIPGGVNLDNLRVVVECSQSMLGKPLELLIKGDGFRKGNIPFQMIQTIHTINSTIAINDPGWIVKSLSIAGEDRLNLPISVTVIDVSEPTWRP